MSFKRAKVVMLPTNEKAVIGFLTQKGKERGHLVHFDRPMPNILDSENQHLYFLSDEEIKDGDWFLPISGIGWALNIPIQADGEGGYNNEHCKKIIATTDKLRLIAKDEFGGIDCQHLPQPSNSFIEKFVEAYNSEKPITEVMVEYEIDQKEDKITYIGGEDRIVEKIWLSKANDNWYFDTNNGLHTWSCTFNKLKVNPKDNTITIKKVKDSWDREEVEELCRKALHTRFTSNICMKEDADKWIENNL